MAKRKRSLELSSPQQNTRVYRKQKVKDNRLHDIIYHIKMNTNKKQILKLIRNYVQYDNEINTNQLHVLLLRFLREIKSSYENAIKKDTINENTIDVIFINNIRQITQTMQELSIDHTVVITKTSKIYNILANDEYKNYIQKTKTQNGFEIEFSAMIVMTIATKKLIEIGNKHSIDDIFDMVSSPMKSASRSPMKSASRSRAKSASRSRAKSASNYAISLKSALKSASRSPAKSSSRSPAKSESKYAISSRSPMKSASRSRDKSVSNYAISSRSRGKSA